MSERQAQALYVYLSDARSPKSQQQLMADLGVSRATLERAKKHLRDVYGIAVLPPANGGYRLCEQDKGRANIGGALMSQSELVDLVQATQLLSQMSEHNHLHALLKGAVAKLNQCLPSHQVALMDKMDMVFHGERKYLASGFRVIVTALTEHKRLHVEYNARTSQSDGVRELSPQRIVRYRNALYLVAFCHLRDALRTFSFDRFVSVCLISQPCLVVPSVEVDAHYKDTYGILGGKKQCEAKIAFSATQARWVHDEVWHAKQRIEKQEDGGLILSIPISEQIVELVQDLARYGKDVTVLEPEFLKEALIRHHREALR